MGNYTVASWLRTWYGVYAEPRIRPNTREYYKNYINNHIVPALGDILLDKLVTLQIQRFYNGLQKNGRVQRKGFPAPKDKSLSPRVVRGVHTLLSNCLDQAVAERLILANPAAGCKLPKLEKKEMRVLPQEKIGLYHRDCHRPSDVKNQRMRAGYPARFSLPLSVQFRVWVTVWVRTNPRILMHQKSCKNSKNPMKSCDFIGFLVRTTGLEPVTSCV